MSVHVGALCASSCYGPASHPQSLCSIFSCCIPASFSLKLFFVEQGPPIMFTTPKVHSMSHTRFTPPSSGVHEPRGCCDVVPALTRCGPLQRRPPHLGSESTHRRAALRRKAIQRCHHSVAEARATLQLYTSELEGTRARWQSDRVSNVRKTIRPTRRGSTAALGSIHEAESEQALGRSASSSVCEYAAALGHDTSSSSEDVGAPLLCSHAESSSVYTITHEPSNSAADFRREGTQLSPMTGWFHVLLIWCGL